MSIRSTERGEFGLGDLCRTFVVVDDDARQVARRLYFEAVTRVSTQQPSSGDGRPSVTHAASGHTVEYFAITMLNYELRPFLSKWHPLLGDFEQAHPGAPEADWPHNAACRTELDDVRGNIVNYALGFGRLAGVHGAESMFSGPVGQGVSSSS